MFIPNNEDFKKRKGLKTLSIVLICIGTVSLFATDVSNGLKPEGNPVALVLTPELTIYGDGSKDFIWGASKTALVVNDAGMIYVMDPDNHQVLKFSPEGKLLKTAGGQGEGPGEFQFMTNLSLRKDGSLTVFETRNGVHVFSHLDSDLNLIAQKKNPPTEGVFLQSASFSHSAPMYTSCWMQATSPKEMTVNGGLWSPEHKQLMVLSSEVFKPFNPERMTDPTWWSEYLAQWFATGPKQAVVVFDDQGGFYHASTHQYKVTHYNSQLKKTLTFGREYKPKVLSENELEKMIDPIKEEVLATLPSQLHSVITDSVVTKAMELADFKPAKQPIFGMLDMADHVLVFHDYDVSSEILTADIFTKKGAFVGSSKLPRIAYNYYGGYFGVYLKMLFRGQKAYALATNEDGDLNVVRYKYELRNK